MLPTLILGTGITEKTTIKKGAHDMLPFAFYFLMCLLFCEPL